MNNYLRLGVNIDHVATIRNARGGVHPEPMRAAITAQNAGADGITAHLREDRRHISDQDIIDLKNNIRLPLNLEMAATEEMLEIALKNKPNAVCIVTEKRQEVTTEGGLDICNMMEILDGYVHKLQGSNIRVSLFLEPDIEIVKRAYELNVDIIEFHTGKYSHLLGEARKKELDRIIKAVELADSFGIECHAGHGLTYDNVADIARIPQLKELNIGHFLIGEAIFLGLENSIMKMRQIIEDVRQSKVA